MTARLLPCWLLIAVATTPALARDWCFNHETGDDTAAGEAGTFAD